MIMVGLTAWGPRASCGRGGTPQKSGARTCRRASIARRCKLGAATRRRRHPGRTPAEPRTVCSRRFRRGARAGVGAFSRRRVDVGEQRLDHVLLLLGGEVLAKVVEDHLVPLAGAHLLEESVGILSLGTSLAQHAREGSDLLGKLGADLTE